MSKRRLSRDEMSEEQKVKLREADRKRKALQRQNETEEQRMQRLEEQRIRTAESIKILITIKKIKNSLSKKKPGQSRAQQLVIYKLPLNMIYSER